MFKKLCLSIACMAWMQFSFAQVKLLEKVPKSGNELVIPYEKYLLPNGLTLIVHEDHSDPICHVDVTYHVGSAREEIGKSGFAHFFEHMMFQGSDHVADEQHFKIITEAGGTLNGTTNRDRTNYFETVPSNQLEKMLWLEADRMGFLLDAVTQKKFEVQRATVKNERGQNYDNRPYGLVQETLAKNLFPKGHPYSWLTIGYVEDLDRVNVEDLKNFFKRWYGPNNAVITVGGDVVTSEVVKMVEKYFGSINRGPEVKKAPSSVPVVSKDRYATMVDQYAKLPQIVCAIPTVPAYHPDEPALDCLAEILGGDNNSMLYQRLVKNQRAQNANAGNYTDELSGALQITVTPKPGQTLQSMEQEIRMALREMSQSAITQEAVDKFKMSYEASMIYRMESVSGKVSQLAAYQTFTNNANYIKEEAKRYKDFTLADVRKAYDTYVKGKGMVILYVQTKEYQELTPGALAGPESDFRYVPENYAGLQYQKAKDAFDRSKMPAAGPNPVIKVPEFKKYEENNMSIIESYSNELPAVVISLSIPGGRMVEQLDLKKAGLANLFAEMMNEDTKRRSAEEMSMALDKLGSSISISSDLDEFVVTVRTLNKNIGPTLDLLLEKLNSPDFSERTFSRIKNQYIENLRNSKSRAANMASLAYNKVMYPPDVLFSKPSTGTISTLELIKLEDIQNVYNNYFGGNKMQVVVVGDFSTSHIQTLKQKLGQFKSGGLKMSDENMALDLINTEGQIIHVVNIPKAAQTEFRIGNHTGLTYDATGPYYQATLMNFLLGGAFNSRINLNLREDKGWTYGARTNFSSNKYLGTFTFSSGIKTPATDSALSEVIQEMRNYIEKGISIDELNFLKNAIGQSEARKYETMFQKAGFLANMLKYQLGSKYTEEQNNLLKKMNAADIKKLAENYLHPEGMHIVLAGDLEKIKPGLEKMGYKVVEMNADELIR
jgi:zinc protease